MVREQLLAEAAALQSVDSPHTLRVVDVVDDAGVLALVTDLVPGVSLRQVLDEHGTLSGQDALVVLRDAALGLAAVHAAGLVHGDVKPANVLVEASGSSRLIDFGLAALPGWVGEDALSPWGSPAYAPPEQVAHGFRDHRSDIYSLTVTLFEVLCGQRPFTGDTVDEVRSKHVSEPLPDPRLFEPRLGDGLTQLLMWGLAKDPDQRPQDVGTWLQYLEAAAEAKYGAGWAVPAGVGAVAGGMLAGGLVASGVLAPATGSTSVAAVAGAGAGGAGTAGAGAAGGSAAGAGAGSAGAGGAGVAGPGATGAAGAGSVGAPAGVGGTAAGAGGTAAAASAATGGFLSTVVGKVAVCAVAIATATGGGILIKDALDSDPVPAVETSPAAPAQEYVEKIVLTTWDTSDPIATPMVAVADPDGSNQFELAAGSDGVLSPDGQTVAFVTPDRGVATVSVTGGESRTIVTSDASSMNPVSGVVWSPDGSTLLYGWIAGANTEAVSQVSSTGPSVMVDEGEPVAGVNSMGSSVLSWGPDGRVVYAELVLTSSTESMADRPSRLFIADSPGAEPQQVGDVEGSSPAWSPDGNLIAYIRTWFDDGLSSQVHVIKPDGTGDRVAVDQDFGQGMPSVVWSPDGAQLAVAVGNGIPRKTSLIDVDSGQMRHLFDSEITDWKRVPVTAEVGAEQTADAASTAGWTDEKEFDPPLYFDGNGKMLSGDNRDVVQMPADWRALVRWNGTNCAPKNFRVRLEKYHPDGFVLGGYDCSDPVEAAWAIWSNRSGPWDLAAGGNGNYDCATLEEALGWRPPAAWDACV